MLLCSLQARCSRLLLALCWCIVGRFISQVALLKSSKCLRDAHYSPPFLLNETLEIRKRKKQDKGSRLEISSRPQKTWQSQFFALCLQKETNLRTFEPLTKHFNLHSAKVVA